MPVNFQPRHGRALRQLRESAGLNGKELAESAGMSAGHLSEIENGRRNLTRGTISKLAEALHYDPDTLADTLEGMSQRPPPDQELRSACPREDSAPASQDQFRAIAEAALVRLPTPDLVALLKEALDDSASGRKNRIAESRMMLDILESRTPPPNESVP